MTNKNYCMSHYLAFRFIKDENINFYDGLKHKVFKPRDEKEIIAVKNADDIDKVIAQKMAEFTQGYECGIFLSGGMDSAILASYMPKGSKAYTFKCIADGAINETEQAKKYADKFQLDHEIIEMYWDDFEKLTPEILEADGVPFHSIEVQLLKAIRHAKSQGIERMIIGNNADLVFGGMDKLIGKDWLFDEFYERYNFVDPQSTLKDGISVKEVYEKYRILDNKIDFLKFIDEILSIESNSSYFNMFKLENMPYLDPYLFMKMKDPLDLTRVRNGEPKYLVRELFAKKYPELGIPNKIPMPRAMNQWLKDYEPTREEFKKGCGKNMNGDQKWLCWCLEKFLDIHEPRENK